MTRDVEIIIIKYTVNDSIKKFEDQTIKSVLSHTEEPYHLKIWQNKTKDENLSVIWNKLIQNSPADYVCLLNSDVLVENRWLQKLLEVFDQENVGAVGPVTNACGIRQQIQPKGNGTENAKTLSGFCMAFPKKVWEEVGGFDEKYKLYGEDSDFCKKIANKYRLVIRKDVFIEHFKSQTMKQAIIEGKNIKKLREEAKERFKKT